MNFVKAILFSAFMLLCYGAVAQNAIPTNLGPIKTTFQDDIGTNVPPSPPSTANTCRRYYNTTTGQETYINSSGGNCGAPSTFVCGNVAVPGLFYYDGTQCVTDTGATFDSVNLVWNFEAIAVAGNVFASKFSTSGAGGVLEMKAQSAPTPGASLFDIYIDTVTGLVHCRNSSSGDCLNTVQFVTSGSTVLSATLVTANGGCNVYSSTATGATSSNAGWPSLHGVDISTISGYLPGQLIVYPPFVGTNLISFKVCNPTVANITPASAVTVFWDIR